MLTRRNFLAAAAGAAAAVLAGCSGEKDEAPAANPATEPVEDAPAADAAPAGNVLVAYFSATGNTEGVVAAIAERLGVDVFAIEAAEPYTEADLNYGDDASRTSVERADARPELAQVTPDGWADYDTVLLGYPIWWGEAAWPLRTFAEGNDFAGKTVVPFCTSGSSGIGGSAELLAGLAGSGEWREGERFSAGAGDEAAEWAAGLGL
ncbi:twin-arginine translocation signal domain-containing protein [Olsenella uli]|uniref:flavodoxin n=1 Tax=Olsenella uli TaxID=133926 RepID=UPI001958813B|nr:flavodoxin [Olsenella uli]MBM6816154.1 twin-arginine translocation signal domain-containing protein [Olsenella uli]